MKTVIVLAFLFNTILLGVPNCNLYKWENNEPCFQACQMAEVALQYPQGSSNSQYYFDKSIALCPEFTYSIVEKAVPFLKRGDFITWKKLIDKAVALEPEKHLGYRGWCRYQFLKDYKGAIKDIEELEKLATFDIGYCQNGDYHLVIAKALAYKGLGQNQKAIEIITRQLQKEGYDPGLYDYLHLGVLHLEMKDLQGAIAGFKKQIEINDYLAETYYYLAIASKLDNKPCDYKNYLMTSKRYYEEGKIRTDTYAEMPDKIYYADILKEINNGLQECT